MRFLDWMLQNKLSQSSALKYSKAIEGTLTDWANDAGITERNLSAFNIKAEFDKVAEKIRHLDIYLERNNRGHGMYNAALNKYLEFLEHHVETVVESDIQQLLSDNTLDETSKLRLVQTRIGQGMFRKKLMEYWRGCAVTGYKDSRLLVASHIKPWSDSSNEERLDVYNGLLLLPNLDAAFDSGLITFDESGRIRISSIFQNAQQLGITSNLSVKLDQRHEVYMLFHRSNVFLAN